jgi:L-amino acid N-acyltransferase YncA
MGLVVSAQLRRATSADANGIAEVNARGWLESYDGLVPASLLSTVRPRPDRWAAQLAAPEGWLRAFVAEEDGVVVGFSACCPQRTVQLADQGYGGEVAAIYLLCSVQRRGLGRSLFLSAAAELEGSGLRGLAVWTLRTNLGARRFYESLGGVLAGERQDVRGDVVLDEVAYGWTGRPAATLGHTDKIINPASRKED